MLLSSAFKSEVRRWVNYWKRQLPVPKISVTQLLASHADTPPFYPNVWELFQVLCVLPVEVWRRRGRFSASGACTTVWP